MYLIQLYCFLSSFAVGYGTNFILPLLGVYNGEKAIKYYSEVHTKKQNIVVHIIGMPFTILGMTLWIPSLGEMLLDYDPYITQYCLFLYYLGLYSYIRYDDCIYYCFMYYPTIMIGNQLYISGFYSLLYGLLLSTSALVFQEIVGHNWGGDAPSRPEGVLNAIFYAKYFSARSLKKLIR